jgi:hypothetical protein
MKRIDSPTDVALTQYEGEPEDTTREIILKVAGKLFPPIGLGTALREHFSSRKRYERIQQVFQAFKSELDSLEKDAAQNEASLQAIEERLRSPKFTEAVLTAAEEAVRTADSKKLDRLACVLANGLDPDIIKPEEDLSSFVRDVSQLSELDIKTLDTIVSMAQYQALLEPSEPKTTDEPKTQKFYFPDAPEFVASADLEKIRNDDFYSYAYRLVGFGLALELPSKTGRRSANNLRFGPTNRGRKLVALLKRRT